PGGAGPSSASVTVTLSASDDGGSGVGTIYFTTDDSAPTTSSAVYSAPFAVTQSTTVRFFATDVVGNAETPHSQSIGIDSSAPTSAISCNAAGCAAGWYRSGVTVTLSASDAGGSGVDKIFFTTDGTTPTTSSAVYNGPLALSQSTTVRFFATDVAGNAESSHAQTIAVDVAAPTASLTCNGASCT